MTIDEARHIAKTTKSYTLRRDMLKYIKRKERENGCFRVGNGYENEAGSYLSDWRIIGNIHENPELLEDEE